MMTNQQFPQTQTGNSDVAFKKWMNDVDAAVSATAFVSVYDLPDQPFRDWFDDGMSAEEAARTALEDADYDFDDDELGDFWD
jgi:hypothetical protein